MSEAAATYAGRDDLRILSVGAGGQTEELLRNTGIRFRSVDNDPAKHPDILASVEDLPTVDDETVDVVFCMEVLEHVGEPSRAIKEFSRILAPTGVIVGSTPFVLGIHDAPNDFYRFTRYGIERLFAGFDRIRLDRRNGYFSAIAVLLLRPLAGGRLKRSLALFPLVIWLVPLLRMLDRFWVSDDGTTGYFFVFRKPGGP
jgi:SAM-dependent methyltransferase